MQKKFIAAILAAALMVPGGTGGMADSRQRIWDIQGSMPVFAEEKSNAAKSAVCDASEYIGRWSELAEELALEEVEDAYFDMENTYENDDGLHLEWDKEEWALINEGEGDASISIFGIRIGDAQGDVRKNIEAIKNKYNAYSWSFNNASNRGVEIMMLVEQEYYVVSITYDSSGKVSEWYFTNLPEGAYDDPRFILDVQKKYGRLEEDSWKSAYIVGLSEIELQSMTSYYKYCLIRLNNDTIPELYILADNERVSKDYLFTAKNGKIDKLVLDRSGRGYFIQNKNLFRYYEPSSGLGAAKENIYTIKNGKFELKASGRIKSHIGGKRSYKWNGKKVSRGKYNKLLQKIYPINKETSMEDGKMYRIDQIIKQIMEA